MTEEEFDAFYATAFPRLTGQLYAFTGDHGEAQDVVEEAFVRAWDRRREVLADGAPEAWVRTVAMRLAVSRWRRARRWVELVRRTPPPEHTPGPDPERAALVAALRKLPEPQRMALVLHHLCDLSVEQVASLVGLARLSVAQPCSQSPSCPGAERQEPPARVARPSGRWSTGP